MRLPIVNHSMSPEMGPTSDYGEMDFVLTEYQKIFIILVAAILFLLSVIITICVVSPICLFNRILFNRCKKPLADVKGKQRLVIGESKHFQLKVVPLYGSHCEKSSSNNHLDPRHLDLGSKESLLTESSNCSYNKQQHLHNNHQTGYSNGSAIKPSNGLPVTMSLPQPGVQPATSNSMTEPKDSIPSVLFGVACEKVDDSTVKLILKVDSVSNCKPKGYGLDPAVFVTIDITTVSGLRAKRRSTLAKVSASFRTNSAKRSVEPEFSESFTSSEFPKSIMKDGRLKIKVMDDERYANDCCLGELTIPLKKFDLNSPMVLTKYQMKPPKETKGDITLGLCYLPTARRVTILATKASLPGQSHNTNYYVRALMFIKGKLMKKKKTSTSQKLLWTEKDALTFDLAQANPEETAFLLVLSSSTDPIAASLSSPSSPETPEIPSGSRKDRHLGHTVIGQDIWRELRHQPRKQINKVLKLM